MPDYEKLTVIKLRDELVSRGLSKTGLKAALVQRLHEADAQAESASVGTLEIHREDKSVTKAVPLEPSALREPKGSDHAADDLLQSGEQDEGELNVREVEDEFTSLHQSEKQISTQYQTVEMREVEEVEGQAPDSFTPKAIRNEKPSGKANKISEQSELPPPISAQTQNGDVQACVDKSDISTHTSLTGDETLEDSRKRKRRSQSPPPSSTVNTQKRFKNGNGRPRVELPEDLVVEGADQQERPTGGQSPRDYVFAQESSTQTNGHTYGKKEGQPAKSTSSGIVGQLDAEGVPHSQTDSLALKDLSPLKERNATPKSIRGVQSPIKSSPSDCRFRTLFTSHANWEIAPPQSQNQDAEEKLVSPALHPATSALYIRELMRPLKIENLKDHLITLATPPGAAMNSDIVTDFFLDSIRTHCLVGFESISAASRVRSGLHDRVWPNERDRRQLWVDFVPEEKLKGWIDIERTAGNGRGHLSKRWEVVYEDEEKGVKAYLQEVGSDSGGLRAAPSVRLDAGQSVHVTGHQTSRSEPQSSQSKPDSGKGFRALDDLFMSTASKPKLYYLPASKAEAGRRLAKLAAGRGGGHGDEMRRFSFEDGSIIDNGPEFVRGYKGERIRSGNHWGRGRGHKVDSSRRESWRERRVGY